MKMSIMMEFVNILDLVLVGQNLGQKLPSNPRADVNRDGQVNVLDLVLVAERLGEKVAAAPTQTDTLASNTFSAEENYCGTACTKRIRSNTPEV